MVATTDTVSLFKLLNLFKYRYVLAPQGVEVQVPPPAPKFYKYLKFKTYLKSKAYLKVKTVCLLGGAVHPAMQAHALAEITG